MTRWQQALVPLGLVAYLAISIPGLTVFPPMGEDEPWVAAAPYKLASRGVLGSDLFTGYYGMERHHFEQMPVFPLMEAGVFRLFGVGVAQMRALPVACGFALLIAVVAAGRQLGGNRVGALALILMITQRVTSGGGTGVLLLDRARINRYDIAVPLFALLALLAFHRAERDRRGTWYLLAGLLTGLSSLSHLYGLFWLPVFAGLLTVRRGWGVLYRNDLWLLLAGFAAPWLIWAAYIATAWSDFVGQMRMDAPRFDLLSPSFYINNIVYENGPISLGWLTRTIRGLPLTRIGTWTMLIGMPAAVWVALWRERRQSSDAVRVLAMASLTQLALFVILLKVKTVSYMIALWPLGALLLAWLGVWLWDRARVAARVALVTLLGLIIAEGAIHVAQVRGEARLVTPYDWYESEVAGCIPPGSVVLGLQRYWLGLRDYPYRSWLLPIDLANPRYSDKPISLDEAFERLNPDVILIDRDIDALMAEAASVQSPSHWLRVGFDAFKARRHATLTCVVRDHTYGTMQIYSVSNAAFR